MKRTITLLLFTLLLLGGKSNGADKAIKVNIVFERGFKNNSVLVYLKEKIVYANKNVSTKNPGKLDYACNAVINVMDHDSSEIVKIVVDNKTVLVFKALYFTTDIYIGVSRSSDGNVLIKLYGKKVNFL
jgi:hypothetical protein